MKKLIMALVFCLCMCVCVPGCGLENDIDDIKDFTNSTQFAAKMSAYEADRLEVLRIQMEELLQYNAVYQFGTHEMSQKLIFMVWASEYPAEYEEYMKAVAESSTTITD